MLENINIFLTERICAQHQGNVKNGKDGKSSGGLKAKMGPKHKLIKFPLFEHI